MNKKCNVCIRHCVLSEGQTGYCGGYTNCQGELKNPAYGRIGLVQREPVSRIPLLFWSERTEALAFTTYGCTFRCTYCFNKEFAHFRPSQKFLACIQERTPQWLVEKASDNTVALATDFVEPAVIFDFVVDTFTLAKEKHVPTILSFAGSLSDESLSKVLPYMTVVRLDIKATTLEEMKALNFWMPGLSPERPFEVAKIANRFCCHIEYTIPVIPGFNTSESDLLWIAQHVIASGNFPVALIAHQKINQNDTWQSANDEDIERVFQILGQYGLIVRKAEI